MGFFSKKSKESAEISTYRSILKNNPNDVKAMTGLVNGYLTELSDLAKAYQEKMPYLMQSEEIMMKLLKERKVIDPKTVEKLMDVYIELEEKVPELKDEVLKKRIDVGFELYNLMQEECDKESHKIDRQKIGWYLILCEDKGLKPMMTKEDIPGGLPKNLEEILNKMILNKAKQANSPA